MAQAFEETLLRAIEKDDKKAFDALTEETPCGKYRLGRFPVLSLLYLFGARRILLAYEKAFVQVSTWQELREPASVMQQFARRAGKCLRLYLSEVVSPLEMLLILDRTGRVKKLYPQVRTTEPVKRRLAAIYSVKYGLNVAFEGGRILLDRRPLTVREKKNLTKTVVCCCLAAAVVIATPVTFTSIFGRRRGGDITRLSHINFARKTTYTLAKDITIPDNFAVEEMNCTIIGGGNKLIFGKGATLGNFSGELRDMEIKTSGSPIFNVCMDSALLSNVTVEVNADREANEHSAFVALANLGTFDGVTVNIGGSLSARGGDAEELIFGGVVAENAYLTKSRYGTIKNSSVHYSDFSLKGELSANATFGGIVGINGGVVENCTVTGKITSDTFDLGGACYVNNNTLSKVTNGADLSQTSDDKNWNPVVGGVVVANASKVEYCKNEGALFTEGKGTAIVGGIAARTYGRNNYCISNGNISVAAPTAFVGGIFGRSEVVISGSYVYFGVADHCIGAGNIEVLVDGEGTSCIGGVGGLVQEGSFNQGTLILGGGVTNCIFLGTIEGENAYVGSLVGVCGAGIYKKNSYTSGNEEYRNFEGNYYVEGGFPAFGAKVTVVEEDEVFDPADDKGATAMPESDVKNTDVYQDILEKFGQPSGEENVHP